MSFENETLTFESDDDLRKPLPSGTKALVQVRPDKDGTVGDFKSGKSDFGPWMLVPFEVVEGEHKGEWASMMLNIKTTDRRFRAVFETVTGIDISSGGNVTFGKFKENLCEGVFEAELGPEKRQGKETGYTTVFRIERLVRARDAAAAAAPVSVPQAVEVAAAGADDSDEDIPF